MRLVDNWRKSVRWFSMQAMALAGAAQLAWVNIPEDLKASIPADWVSYGTAALLLVGMVGRLVSQDSA